MCLRRVTEMQYREWGTGSVDVISTYVTLSNQSESLYAAEGAGLSSD